MWITFISEKFFNGENDEKFYFIQRDGFKKMRKRQNRADCKPGYLQVAASPVSANNFYYDTDRLF